MNSPIYSAPFWAIQVSGNKQLFFFSFLWHWNCARKRIKNQPITTRGIMWRRSSPVPPDSGCLSAGSAVCRGWSQFLASEMFCWDLTSFCSCFKARFRIHHFLSFVLNSVIFCRCKWNIPLSSHGDVMHFLQHWFHQCSHTRHSNAIY